MKKLLLLLLLLGTAGNAQNLKGTIYNAETSESLAGVTILNQASEILGVSNEQGNFSINIEEFPALLEFNSLGFVSRSISFSEPELELQISLQPLAENLSEVIVRSTAIPTRIREMAGSVSLLPQEELMRNDNVNLTGSFNRVPGMFTNVGALNTNKINIRGIGTRAQYSTNRIQSYFDGIPLTTAEGELTLDDFDAETLDRIEVIKGPTSSIYGAGLAGSINLYSKMPQESQISVRSQMGSFNTRKQVIGASLASENSGINIAFTDLQSDGFRENGEYSRQSGLVNARLLTSENNSLSFLANFTRLKAFIPSSINESDFRNNPETADANWAQSRGFESYDRGLIGVTYQHRFSENLSNSTSVFMNFRDAYEPRPFDILKEERVSAGARTRFNLSSELFSKKTDFAIGAEYFNEWYETGTFENLFRQFETPGSVRGARLSNNEQLRNYLNVFAQMNLQLTDRWRWEAGFNINSTGYSLEDLFYDEETDISGDYRFGTIFSPRLGSSYELAAGKNIYASVSHGFSIPTVAETLTPDGSINTNLDAERGVNYEIGFKANWLNNQLYTEISAFSIHISDLLVAQRVAEDQYVGLNAGETRHNGIELLSSYNFSPVNGLSLNPYFNAAFNFFRFEDFINNDQDFSGNEIPGAPASTLNFGLDVKTDAGFQFLSLYQVVGEIPLNDANSLYTDSYQLLNFRAAYNFYLFRDLEMNMYAGVNNALDEHYAGSVLTNAVGFGGAAPRYFYPGMPRNYYAGINLNYIF